MTWQAEPTKTPTSLGMIVLKFVDRDGEAEHHDAFFSIEILDADGKRMTVKIGNLLPHLTAQQEIQLLAFMATMRAKAEAEILGD